MRVFRYSNPLHAEAARTLNRMYQSVVYAEKKEQRPVRGLHYMWVLGRKEASAVGCCSDPDVSTESAFGIPVCISGRDDSRIDLVKVIA